MEIKSNAINPAPATSTPDGKIYFVVREARFFGDRTGYAELTPEAVQKYCPEMVPCIDWENKAFNLPLQPGFAGVSGGRFEWSLNDSFNGLAVYVAHALLAAGFSGNAHYELSPSGGEHLVYDDGDVVAAWCERAADDNPAKIISLFTLHNRETLKRADVQEALAVALRRYFGGNISVLMDKPWVKQGFISQQDMGSYVGVCEKIGEVTPEELASVWAQVPHRIMFVVERRGEKKCSWNVFAPSQGEKIAGVLSRDGALLSARREKYGQMYPVGCEARKHIDEEGF